MEYVEQLFTAPAVEALIDREPLIVTPDISLKLAIALMSQKNATCIIDKADDTEFTFGNISSSCVLIVEGIKLQGILTERDIVRLSARQVSFESVTVAEVMTRSVQTLTISQVKDVFAALFLFRRYRIRHLPVVDDNNYLLGVISLLSIRRAMRPTSLLKVRRVADVMSRNIIHAPANTTVLQVAQLMTTNRVSCVIITQTDLEDNILIPVGIITERDILQFQFLETRLDNLVAEEVMSKPLFLLSPEDSLLKAHQQMQRLRVRRLVVSGNWGQKISVITQTSLLRVFDPVEMFRVIETLQSTVQQLEREKALLASGKTIDKLQNP